MHRQAGEHHRHDHRARTRDHRHLDPCLDGIAHQRKSGIGNTGCPGVGHQRNRFAFLQRLDDTRPGAALVVLVKRNLRLLNIEMFEHQSGFARIFAGDQIDLAQRVQCAQRDIAEITNRRCDKVEHIRLGEID